MRAMPSVCTGVKIALAPLLQESNGIQCVRRLADGELPRCPLFHVREILDVYFCDYLRLIPLTCTGSSVQIIL